MKRGLTFNAKGDLIYQNIFAVEAGGSADIHLYTNGTIVTNSGTVYWVETGSGWVGSSAYTLDNFQTSGNDPDYLELPSEGAITSTKTFRLEIDYACDIKTASLTFDITDSKGNTVTYDAFLHAEDDC